MSLRREFAIQLPNGKLASRADLTPNPFLIPTDEPMVFHSETDAKEAAQHIRGVARKCGVDDLLVRVVHCWCGPWTTEDHGEQIARDFLDYLREEA